MLDKVSLVVVQLVLPVVAVHSEVDFLGGPEGRFGLLVHLPDLYGRNTSVENELR